MANGVLRLKRKTREIFERCYANSGWIYTDAIFLSKWDNWEKFKQFGREKERNKNVQD